MTALVVAFMVVGFLLGVAWPWVARPDFAEAQRYLAAKAAAQRPAITVPGLRTPAEAETPAKAAARHGSHVP